MNNISAVTVFHSLAFKRRICLKYAHLNYWREYMPYPVYKHIMDDAGTVMIASANQPHLPTLLQQIFDAYKPSMTMEEFLTMTAANDVIYEELKKSYHQLYYCPGVMLSSVSSNFVTAASDSDSDSDSDSSSNSSSDGEEDNDYDPIDEEEDPLIFTFLEYYME